MFVLTISLDQLGSNYGGKSCQVVGKKNMLCSIFYCHDWEYIQLLLMCTMDVSEHFEMRLLAFTPTCEDEEGST